MNNKLAILISIKPQWVEKILNGEKTIEIRKSFPKCKMPIDVYIYCTKSDINLYDCFRTRYAYFDGAVAEPFDDEFGYMITKDEVKKHSRWSWGMGFYDDYCRKLNGKIVAKFTLNNIERFDVPYPAWFYEVKEKLQHITDGSCLSLMSLHHYLKNDSGYAWHIDNLQIFEKPMELSQFYNNKALTYNDWLYGIYSGGKGSKGNYNSYLNMFKLKKAPQSWQYVILEEKE